MDLETFQKKFGLTKYMVDKYVKLARLPNELKQAITQGEIHPSPKIAENAVITAVESLGWTPNSKIWIVKIIELAKKYVKSKSGTNKKNII